jgi:hypothetical protein
VPASLHLFDDRRAESIEIVDAAIDNDLIVINRGAPAPFLGVAPAHQSAQI